MRIHRVILITILIFLSSPSHAAIVTFKASGKITSVSQQLGTIGIGDSFDLYYTFDSAASDSDPSESRGVYTLQSIVLNIETYNAETANGISGLITVDNSGIVGNIDRYTLNSSAPSGFYSHVAPLIGDRGLISIVTQYTDNDASIFSSDALPLVPFDINKFESAQLELLFSNNWQNNVAFDAQWVYGNITSITAVPIPGGAYLFGSGILLLYSLRKRVRGRTYLLEESPRDD